MGHATSTCRCPGARRTSPAHLSDQLPDAANVDSEVAAALSEDASSCTWVAAAVGSNGAAGYRLGHPVAQTIGGVTMYDLTQPSS